MASQRNKWQTLVEQCRNDRRWPKKNTLFDFRVSNCGRYGFLVYDVPFSQQFHSGTHNYLYIFEVIDTVTNNIVLYKQMTGTFKTYHRFYLLSEKLGVLVDFSRSDGRVGQHLIEFDHLNTTVFCKESCYWKFRVDEMLFQTNGIYVTATNDLIYMRNITFLPLLGQVDYLPDSMILRFVPADPRISHIPLNHEVVSERFFACELSSMLRQHLQRITDDSSIVDQARLTPDYPLLYNDSLWFFLSRRMDFDETALHCLDIRFLLSLSVEKLLFSPTERNYACENSSVDESIQYYVLFDFENKLEMLDSDSECTSLHCLRTECEQLKPDSSYIDSYTYVQSMERCYLRLDFWEYKEKWLLNSEWVTLDLDEKKWFSWKRKPTSNKIPFWFSALPDGRMIIYRKQNLNRARGRIRKRQHATSTGITISEPNEEPNTVIVMETSSIKLEEATERHQHDQTQKQPQNSKNQKKNRILQFQRRYRIHEPPRKVRSLNKFAFDVSRQLAVQYNEDQEAQKFIDLLQRVCNPY
uniref:Uncharacterized protein n=1 Tax=Acrobeloides nanus TaxID=290746 RepID=A0A914C4L8_9BILA